ncbi:MAG TPA: hypothetical protein VJH94_01765 [Candidatus Paceibacterota bacterium]
MQAKSIIKKEQLPLFEAAELPCPPQVEMVEQWQTNAEREWQRINVPQGAKSWNGFFGHTSLNWHIAVGSPLRKKSWENSTRTAE